MGILTTTLAAQAVPAIAALAYRPKPDGHSSLGIAAQQLLQLNFRYLALAATCPEFSGAIAAQLSDASPEQSLRMADCRFSLFSLALNDSCRWLPLLSRGFIDTRMRAALSLDMAGSREFATSVVFLAWHFAQSQPLAAKVLLGMSDEVATGLRRIPIAHLPAIAGSASDWLMPRWPQHPIFWSALLRHSRDPLGVRLLAIKSLGRQLLAAESLEVQNLPKVADKRLLSSNLSVRSTVNTNKAGLGGQSHEPINGNRQRARQSR